MGKWATPYAISYRILWIICLQDLSQLPPRQPYYGKRLELRTLKCILNKGGSNNWVATYEQVTETRNRVTFSEVITQGMILAKENSSTVHNWNYQIDKKKKKKSYLPHRHM